MQNGVTNMKKRKNPVVNEEKMNILANEKNLEPADSVDEHSLIETGNLILSRDEIQQQNDNL